MGTLVSSAESVFFFFFYLWNRHYAESCQGVPAYPLYKRLASALEEAISSGVSFPRHESPAWFNQEDDIHDKEVLDQLISCEGAELLNVRIIFMRWELLFCIKDMSPGQSRNLILLY